MMKRTRVILTPTGVTEFHILVTGCTLASGLHTGLCPSLLESGNSVYMELYMLASLVKIIKQETQVSMTSLPYTH